MYSDQAQEMVAAEKRRRSAPRIPYLGPSPDRSGPDGNGKDPRIKSVADFERCMGEVVANLPSLEIFVWACVCAPIPLSALGALNCATRLKKLQLLTQTGARQKSTGEAAVRREMRAKLKIDPACPLIYQQCLTGN